MVIRLFGEHRETDLGVSADLARLAGKGVRLRDLGDGRWALVRGHYRLSPSIRMTSEEAARVQEVLGAVL